MGDGFDPEKCQLGVDMAFLLEPIDAPAAWVEETRQLKRIGINISGLIYNSPEEAKNRYGIAVDYKAAMIELVQRLVLEEDCHISLVPHVLVEESNPESDLAASKDLIRQLPEMIRDRVEIIPSDLNEREIKGYIRAFDWFCGMRMHATIAGLSSSVPTLNVAYSGKALGVFETVGQGAQVADARKLSQTELCEVAIECYRHRTSIRAEIDQKLLDVRKIAAAQMEKVASGIDTQNRKARFDEYKVAQK